MNSLRKSPVVRATAWLLTLALIVPLLMLGKRPALAQTQQAIIVIVADFIDVRTNTTDALAIQARDAVYNELAASGQGRFNPIPQKELLSEARQLGIRVPSNPNQPANFSNADLIRLAKALNAEGIVKGKVNVAVDKRGRATTVALDITITDALTTTDDALNGAINRQAVQPRPGEPVEEATTRAVTDTALDVVRQMVQRQSVTATVLNLNVEDVIINRGTRDGLKVGDELIVQEFQQNGSLVSKGKIRVARAYATDSECEVIINHGIRPEDIARALYRPEVKLDIKNIGSANTNSTRINFSTIGKTLAVIGLGVLVAVAVKGGQTSVTNLTAEASSESNAPIVRIRFGDNVFGQGGVLQYKIYRDPDFPFTSPGSGSNNGSTGGTNGTAQGAIPVGTAAGTIREFIDRASPNRPFVTGSYLIATSNGGNNTGGVSTSGSSSGGGGTGGGGGTSGQGGCNSQGGVNTDTGFTPGRTYRYEVTAIILRQIVQNNTASGGGGTGGLGGGGTGGSIGGGGIGGGTGGTGGTGGGTGGGSGNTSSNSSQCIETDPLRSQIATPITPVLTTAPTTGATNIDLRQFSPSFGSRAGADLFQIEVSTDRTFSNPKLIFRQQLISTAPTQDNIAQNLSTPINLTQSSELLNNQTFSNFVGANSTTTPQVPTLYLRVGARHDEDIPGPVHAISQNSSDQDRSFRFVYSQIIPFQPVPLPPANPGSTSKVASILNRNGVTSRAVLPLPGSRRSLTGAHSSTPQDVLTGRQRRRN